MPATPLQFEEDLYELLQLDEFADSFQIRTACYRLSYLDAIDMEKSEKKRLRICRQRNFAKNVLITAEGRETYERQNEMRKVRPGFDLTDASRLQRILYAATSILNRRLCTLVGLRTLSQAQDLIADDLKGVPVLDPCKITRFTVRPQRAVFFAFKVTVQSSLNSVILAARSGARFKIMTFTPEGLVAHLKTGGGCICEFGSLVFTRRPYPRKVGNSLQPGTHLGAVFNDSLFFKQKITVLHYPINDAYFSRSRRF